MPSRIALADPASIIIMLEVVSVGGAPPGPGPVVVIVVEHLQDFGAPSSLCLATKSKANIIYSLEASQRTNKQTIFLQKKTKVQIQIQISLWPWPPVEQALGLVWVSSQVIRSLGLNW